MATIEVRIILDDETDRISISYPTNRIIALGLIERAKAKLFKDFEADSDEPKKKRGRSDIVIAGRLPIPPGVPKT